MIKYIIYGIIGFIIFIISILFLFFIISRFRNLSQNSENFSKQIEELKKADTCPGPIELPCRAGPKGDQGPAGGLYQERGLLMNLAETNMVADRMYGYGPQSVAYLSTKNYKPQQKWTLYSALGNTLLDPKNGGDLANKISNQYGGCLNVNDKDDTLHMVPPANCKNATPWLYTAQGTLQSKKNPNKCLSYTNAGIIKNAEKAGIINAPPSSTPGASQPQNPYQSLLQLKMMDCDPKVPANQQWTFL